MLGYTAIKNFFNKNKEVILYLFFGILTFIISIISYIIFNTKMNELLSNIFSWILSVSFAYITNKIWVFKSNSKFISCIISEILSFFSGRILTLVIEEIILLLFITLLHFNSIAVKTIAQIIVIILNYIISKLFVFNKLL